MVLLLAGVGPILALARLAGAPPSVVLFAAGLLSTYVPGLPPLRVDPQLLLDLLLPPLVYASTVRVSRHLLRFTLVPGLLYGALIVLTTVAAVALVARQLLPGLSWEAALLLGVVASIFDTRLFHEAQGRPHLPRAVADTLKARELVSRLFILATFALVLEAAGSEVPSGLAVLEHFALAIPLGVLLGLAVGEMVGWLRKRIDPAPVEIAVSITTPYLASLAAAALGVSGVAAITTAALVISTVRIDRRTGAPISSAEARISAVAFWEEASLIVSSFLFLLAGRALPEALAALDEWPLPRLVVMALSALAVVVAVQVAFSYLAVLGRGTTRALGRTDEGTATRRGAAWVMAWSSTRSVIGLVIALSVPETLPDGTAFPSRELVLVVAALMILGSILVQGLTLRWVVAWAALGAEAERSLEEELAKKAMTAASPSRGTANAFDTARRALLRLRERNRIGDEVLIAMLRETDLAARTTGGNALPGAGPPSP